MIFEQSTLIRGIRSIIHSNASAQLAIIVSDFDYQIICTFTYAEQGFIIE
jgi:hypothetical protein